MTGLVIDDVTVRYRSFAAVKNVRLSVPPGSALGVAGESGSGKSTLARAIAGLVPVSAGSIRLDDHDLARMTPRWRRRVQMIFQDSAGALDPRLTAGASIGEAISGLRGEARRRRVAELIELVRLDASVADARPGQLSGGQRQRVAIARALAAEPELLIADEITSALDVSVQASILNLLRDLRGTLGLSLIFISHNLAAVRYISTDVAVMYLGRVVETASAADLFATPQHPYTRQLLTSVPRVGDRPADASAVPDVDVADPRRPPSGCPFHPRCPVGPLVDASRSVCLSRDPQQAAEIRRHRAACHFVPGADLEERPAVVTG
jgi:peptide/nickel transport system ATP-binding protein